MLFKNKQKNQTNHKKTKSNKTKKKGEKRRLCCSSNLQFKTARLTHLAYIKETLSTVNNDRVTLIWLASQPQQWQLAFLFWNQFTEAMIYKRRNIIKRSVTNRLQSYKQQSRNYLLAEFMFLIFPNTTFSSIQRTKWKDLTLKNPLWGTTETRGEDSHYF